MEYFVGFIVAIALLGYLISLGVIIFRFLHQNRISPEVKKLVQETKEIVRNTNAIVNKTMDFMGHEDLIYKAFHGPSSVAEYVVFVYAYEITPEVNRELHGNCYGQKLDDVLQSHLFEQTYEVQTSRRNLVINAFAEGESNNCVLAGGVM